MLFNSYQFILVFVPLVLLVFYWLGGREWPDARHSAQYWLIAASLFFYAWWRPANVLLIAPSIAINFALVQVLLRLGPRRPALSAAAFWSGIAFNLLFLGYFKYRNFGFELAHDVLGSGLRVETLILPLGISFITFQKIALLIDVRAGRVAAVNLRDYALFVLFFPQLIAGPIVHYREMMPQFGRTPARPQGTDFAVGLTLFFAGLFKKVMLADPISGLIDPVWNQAAHGGSPALVQAWGAALGYMLQLYFDFSGYSDMAIGAARLFGIKLPYNFNSPLKATNIIDFWSRWHVTLTRFLTAYIFSPLTLQLTRSRARRGLPIMAGRRATPSSFFVLLAYPTMVTMVLAGIWHGAGYQFLVFGVLHGVALICNHAWHVVKARRWPGAKGHGGMPADLAGWAATFLFVVVAQVFFRAASAGAGLSILHGMAGAGGFTLPAAILPRAAPLLAAFHLHAAPVFESGQEFVQLWGWIAAGLAVMLGLPNIYELLAAYDPALGFKIRPGGVTRIQQALSWSPSVGWAFGVSILTVFGLLSLGRLSDFLYWHF